MRVAVLGPLLVSEGDRVLDPGPPRNREVLAELVLAAGRVVDVDVLVDRVWGGLTTPATTSSVHVTVSRLRKALRPAGGGPSPIRTQAPGYRLAVERSDVDALRFADLVEEARRLADVGRPGRAGAQLGVALGLWRGEPFAGIRTESVRAEADRLEALRLAAVELSADLDLRLGRHAELTERLAAVALAHPLREGLQASLMTALYRHGRQSEALVVFERTRRVLADELGIDPGRELQRLHGRVLHHDPALEWRPPAPAVPVPRRPAEDVVPAAPARPPMVGRSVELARALAVLDRLAAGRAAGLALFGESGIGKTRLAEEVADRAADRGADVVWGRCTDGGGAPAFWPWTQALEALAEARGAGFGAALTGRAAAAAVLLPARPGDAAGSGSSRVQLFDAVAALLSALAAERPVCLVLEDLQWADHDSVDLLDYVLSAVTGAPLLVLVTVRDPDESPHSAGGRVLAAVTRQAGTDRLHLAGLDAGAVGEYATGRLGRPVSGAAAGRLRRRTSGNPFFLGELVRLVADEGSSRTAGSDVPASVQAVLERRYRHLPDSTRTVLSAAAVIGRAVELRVLAGVLGRPPVELCGDLDRAVAAGVLGEDPAEPGHYTFPHALVQEALLAATGPMRRAALHAQVAAALETGAGSPDHVAAALAWHHRRAGVVGDPEKAAHFSLVAAASARRRAAPREAERHCRDALAVLEGLSGPRAGRLEREARRQLAGLLTMTLGYDTSSVARQRSRDADSLAARADARPRMTGEVAVALAANDLPAAERLVTEMEQAAERWDDPTLRLSAHHARGQVQVLRGRIRAGLGQFSAAVELLERAADEVDLGLFIQDPRASARAWRGMAQTLMGEVAAGDASVAAGRIAADASGDLYTTAMFDYLESWRLVFLGRADEARLAATVAVEGARELRLDKLEALALHPLASATARLGGVAEGLTVIRDAHAMLQRVAPGDLLSHLLLGLMAEVEELAGLDEDADRTALRALAEGERTGERVYQPAVHLLRARVGRRLGAGPEQTRRTLLTGLSVAAAQEAELFAVRLRAELDRLD